MNKIDAPFLSKFVGDSIYLKSEDDICKSVIDEIANILSTKLKTLDKDASSPFSYGVRDLQSIDSSDEGLAAFKQHCAEQILRYEPRLEDIYIGSCVINKMTQSLEMEITCKIRGQRNELSTKIYVD